MVNCTLSGLSTLSTPIKGVESDITIAGMTDKKCCICNLEKSLEMYHKNKRWKDGRDIKCRQCKREYDKQHYPKIREKRINQVEIYNLVNKKA